MIHEHVKVLIWFMSMWRSLYDSWACEGPYMIHEHVKVLIWFMRMWRSLCDLCQGCRSRGQTVTQEDMCKNVRRDIRIHDLYKGFKVGEPSHKGIFQIRIYDLQNGYKGRGRTFTQRNSPEEGQRKRDEEKRIKETKARNQRNAFFFLEDIHILKKSQCVRALTVVWMH
jgi:hypothetical protein